MKISVVIPTYNSSRVIVKTLESVFRQAVPPEEVLVLDDGSTDDTVSILKSFGSRVSVFQQTNHGVATARNELCQRASGDLVAFLDHDDLWHPRYLEIQSQAFAMYPDAVAFFTRHYDFYGLGDYDWHSTSLDFSIASERISPVNFVERYNSSTGTFYSMSFCCIPKSVMLRLGDKPFCEQVSGVDDCYIGNLLPLFGPVVFKPIPLVAYRITEHAQSVNQLKNFKLVVDVFQLLEKRYQALGDKQLWNAFNTAFAGKRRRYGKTLMGTGRVAEARLQFKSALKQSPNPASMAKSASLFCLSCLPPQLQPRWPSSSRQAVTRTGATGQQRT